MHHLHFSWFLPATTWQPFTAHTFPPSDQICHQPVSRLDARHHRPVTSLMWNPVSVSVFSSKIKEGALYISPTNRCCEDNQCDWLHLSVVIMLGLFSVYLYQQAPDSVTFQQCLASMVPQLAPLRFCLTTLSGTIGCHSSNRTNNFISSIT